MLQIEPSSTLAFVLLACCFVLVLAFEFANGFHDTANAVATVIYTNSLKPRQAVVWSGLLNFLGVLLGGISVAYALVELLPSAVLSPPNGNPAVAMLVALFGTALFWNLLTWWFGIPNSSSHCVIGALIGIAVGHALLNAHNLTRGVDWSQVWTVLRALAISPILGLIGAGALYFVVRRLIHDRHLYEPPKDGKPPAWWVRGLLILTCTSVSFSHGTNDGQKSIGLIMLTIIGMMPASFALNPEAHDPLQHLAQTAQRARPLVERYGDEERQLALQAADNLGQLQPRLIAFVNSPEGNRTASDAAPAQAAPGGFAPAVRNDVYRIIQELRIAARNPAASAQDKQAAHTLEGQLRPAVEYAPVWVRALSALCLGLGTMVGYRRIVHTLGERVGRTHLTPAQGASAELVGAALIGTAGFTGLPVSTTHIITSGIAGTMIGSGSGLNRGMLVRIIGAWVFTLPVTIALAAATFFLLAGGV